MPTLIDPDIVLFPSSIIKGEAIDLDISIPEYPASTPYTLRYAGVIAGEQIQFDAAPNGDDYLLQLSSATTDAWEPGRYSMQVWVVDGSSNRTYIRTGVSMEVLRDWLSEAGGYDGRTDNRIIYDALVATMQGKATKDQMSYQIAGRSISRLSLTELREAIAYYRRLVDQEEADEDRRNGKTDIGLAKIYRNLEPS